MRKINLFLFAPIFLLLSCKSESNSYNDVVQKASSQIEAEHEVENPKKEIGVDTLDIDEAIESDEESIGKSDSPIDQETNKTVLEKKNAAPEQVAPPKQVAKSNKGIMTFDKYVHEFGTITEGDIIKHDFYFTNTGTGVINVKNASATCGCTIPSYPFIPVGPGERGFIGVTYNSVGKSGIQTPVITVISDGKEKVSKLKLTGEVVDKSQDSPEKKDTSGLSQ